MKKVLASLIIIMFAAGLVWARAGKGGYATPEVSYISPESESLIDIAGVDKITFSWKPTPIPANGRVSYRFELFRGYEYDRLVNETLEENVYSVDVPASLFRSGETYTWQVRQRDRFTKNWSDYHRRSFTVK